MPDKQTTYTVHITRNLTDNSERYDNAHYPNVEELLRELKWELLAPRTGLTSLVLTIVLHQERS